MIVVGSRANRKLRIRPPPILTHGVAAHLAAVGIVNQVVEEWASRRALTNTRIMFYALIPFDAD